MPRILKMADGGDPGGDMPVAEQQSCGSLMGPLARLEKLVEEIEQLTPRIGSQLIDQLQHCLASLPSNLTSDESLDVWTLSYSIWNCCVTVANSLQPGGKLDEDHARLRQMACDLLILAGNRVDGEIVSPHFEISAFLFRTGIIWHSLKRFEQAAVCFEKVTGLMSQAHERNDMPRTKKEQEFMFDLFVARSETAWELSQRALASSLSARARGLLSLLPERSVQLAEHYFEFGQSLLSKQDTESQTDAIKYLEQAFEIISSTPAAALNSCTSTSEDEPRAGLIPDLKMEILRYLAAAHLLRENYESVLKCLTVLKLAPNHHPCTSYYALKALAGLGRYEEAEKELVALAHDKTSNVEACMSGIEIVSQDPSRLDAAKRAFLALHSRHPSNKSLPVRILECLLRRHLPDANALSNVKVLDVVLQIASNEGIVTTVTGVDHDHGGSMLENANSVSKEQECIHALLWNHGSELFQAKQYQTCIKLFEASMLYLPRDSESNLQRAKSLRVLSLCRLALMQCDRALEYVTEAEKVDPNIACAFLKFKIHLQMKNEAAAADQVEKMTSCSDFESEYLSLASHEALTCNSTKIAISALSMYLDLPREQRTAGTTDVVVIRNIVALALQDEPLHLTVVVKYLKEAQARLADCGFDAFFGLGNLGQQEANWFAITSWNQGLAAVKKTHGLQLAGDYFSCAADFYASLPDTEENLRCLQQSLLLATSSLLASTTGDECLRSASRMLEKCRKVHRALTMSTNPTDVTKNDFEIHLNLLGFEMKNRTKDFKSQIDILHQCASLPGFEAQHFLHMARQVSTSLGIGSDSTEVISTAYRLALKSILNSPSPDYKLVAWIERKLIILADQDCKDGSEVMAVYKHVKEILAGLDPGEYPQDELQWLVATSWNRAGLQVKFQRFSVAEPWMAMAIDLADHDPYMENRKLSMIESLKEVRQNKQSPMADGNLQQQTLLQ